MMKTFNKFLKLNWKYISVFFIIFNAQWFYAQNDSKSHLDNEYFNNPYFTLEGNVSQTCRELLVNSLSALPQEIKNYLIEEITRRGEKYLFKKVSFEESSNTHFHGTYYGTPVFYADSHTIYHSTNYCAPLEQIIIHEIGHLVHASIGINQPALYKDWYNLWLDVFERHGAYENPFEFRFQNSNSPFIGWKDIDNYLEGFAQLIMLSAAAPYDEMNSYQGNTHPDFLRKVDFLKNKLIQ